MIREYWFNLYEYGRVGGPHLTRPSVDESAPFGPGRRIARIRVRLK